MIQTKTHTFRYGGFDITLQERPDLCYLYAIHGVKDDKHWLPKIMLDPCLSDSEMYQAVRDMLDGVFTGQIEVYGPHHVYAGVRS